MSGACRTASPSSPAPACVGPGWGNGRATAVRFAEEGAKVFAVDRDLASTAETVDR